jgi:hypothetical protein
MNLKDCRETFYEFSGKLSDNTRNLAFAGIAIVWIFKQEKNSLFTIPNVLAISMLMFVLSLSFDLLQYIYQTIVWGSFHTYQEKKLKNDENADFLAPCIFKNIANIIFWIKVVFLILGYIFVVRFLLRLVS